VSDHSWIKDGTINPKWEYVICSKCRLKRATLLEVTYLYHVGTIFYTFDDWCMEKLLHEDIPCDEVASALIMKDALE